MANDLVASAKALRSTIIESRDATEEQRCLAEPIVRRLIESRLCRLALPSDLDGLEADPVAALEVYEELAKAEASVAWFVWNNWLACFFSRFLADSVRSRVFGDPSQLHAGSTRPSGRAVVEDIGFRVSGRWSLVSGCVHAEWIFLSCLVEKDGEVLMAAPGVAEMRVVFIPKGSYEIVDTWHVGGLRGTGSHDLVVENVRVPAERTFSPGDPTRVERPIGRVPIGCTMSAGNAAMCLGVAQATLDAVLDLGHTKVTADPVPDLRDRPSNQSAVAATSARIAAARRQVHHALRSLWRTVESGRTWTDEDLADVWSAAVTTAMECRSAVTTMYAVAGTTALYTDCVIERAHRDIHAILQHVVVQSTWLEQAGRVKLGLDASNPLYAF